MCRMDLDTPLPEQSWWVLVSNMRAFSTLSPLCSENQNANHSRSRSKSAIRAVQQWCMMVYDQWFKYNLLFSFHCLYYSVLFAKKRCSNTPSRLSTMMDQECWSNCRLWGLYSTGMQSESGNTTWFGGSPIWTIPMRDSRTYSTVRGNVRKGVGLTV